MFVRCFCELNVCLDEYELFARPRVAGHYNYEKLAMIVNEMTGFYSAK